MYALEKPWSPSRVTLAVPSAEESLQESNTPGERAQAERSAGRAIVLLPGRGFAGTLMADALDAKGNPSPLAVCSRVRSPRTRWWIQSLDDRESGGCVGPGCQGKGMGRGHCKQIKQTIGKEGAEQETQVEGDLP